MSCRNRRRSSPAASPKGASGTAWRGNSSRTAAKKASLRSSWSRSRQRRRVTWPLAACSGADPSPQPQAPPPAHPPAGSPCGLSGSSWLMLSTVLSRAVLTVADRAAGLALDAVLLDQGGALRLGQRRRVPGGVEHLAPRPHVLGGVAVAGHAPLHLQAARLEGERHAADLAVAAGAADPLGDVDAVVEV